MIVTTLTGAAVLLLKAAAYYFVGMTLFSAAIAVWQEHKIWKPASLPSLSLFGHVKVFVFNIGWMSLCLVGVIAICTKWILSGGTSDIQRDGHQLAEYYVATFLLRCFVGDVQTVGEEHLPPEDQVPAPVYVANHCSQIDVAAVYYINRRFKWIAKSSTLYLPGVGQVMYLSGHVFIYRKSGKNKKSVSNLFDMSDAAVRSGIPMFFFPQGTRRIAQELPFKSGAFIVAKNNKSSLVPLSLEISTNAWNSWYPLNLLWDKSGNSRRPVMKITIHKPVKVTGDEDIEELKKRCRDQIYSVLPAISDCNTSENKKVQ